MSAIWQNWSQRERLLVMAGAAVVAFLLLNLVPGGNQTRGPNLAQRVASQKTDLQFIKQAASNRSQTTSRTRNGQLANASIVVVIDTTTRQHKLSSYLQQNQSPDNNSARVSFKDAPFNDVVSWLGTLENNHHVVAESANINLSDAPGLVDARFSLRR